MVGLGLMVARESNNEMVGLGAMAANGRASKMLLRRDGTEWPRMNQQ